MVTSGGSILQEGTGLRKLQKFSPGRPPSPFETAESELGTGLSKDQGTVGETETLYIPSSHDLDQIMPCPVLPFSGQFSHMPNNHY